MTFWLSILYLLLQTGYTKTAASFFIYLLFVWAAEPRKSCHLVTVCSILSPGGGVASRIEKKELAGVLTYLLPWDSKHTAQKTELSSRTRHHRRQLVVHTVKNRLSITFLPYRGRHGCSKNKKENHEASCTFGSKRIAKQNLAKSRAKVRGTNGT